MPWPPELFSAPALERILSHAATERAAAPVPYFDGVRAAEIGALARAFVGEPELHHPIRGRVKGRRAFEQFVAETAGWLNERGVVAGAVERITTPWCSVEETVLTFEVEGRRVELPEAIVAERDAQAHILELRLYYSTWPSTGRRARRPPLLQPDPDVRLADVVAEYQDALAAGDVAAAVAAFEADATYREPTGSVHRGHDELAALHEGLFSHGGGIPFEHCSVTDDGHACALEYNIVYWGRAVLRPQAGLAVYVRGSTGKLAAVRVYDDVEPPLVSEL
jgi:hypothetical protein